jgi:hypothetical protein
MIKNSRQNCSTLRDTAETGTSSRWLLTAGLLAVLNGVLALGIPPAAKGQITGSGSLLEIRVENYSRATPATLVRAEREASQILQKTGLQTEWTNCTIEGLNENRSESCLGSVESAGVELRIVVETGRKHLRDSEFGFAVVPSFARVYYERVTRVAAFDDAVFEGPILLGCVIAHEIGHLLLGPNSHSQSGIMLARWERQQIRQAVTGRLLFTEEEAHRIRREVAIRTNQQDSHFEDGLIQPVSDKNTR